MIISMGEDKVFVSVGIYQSNDPDQVDLPALVFEPTDTVQTKSRTLDIFTPTDKDVVITFKKVEGIKLLISQLSKLLMEVESHE